MDVAGTAIGVASLGISVCQGLLEYYQACESYDRDILDALKWIATLQRTLVVLGDLLQCTNANQDVFQNTQTGLLDCEDGISKLENKLRKIRKGNPVTAREKTKALGHRLIYPFQQSTIAKLKEIVKDLFDHMLLSTHVLQLDTGSSTKTLALRIDDTVASISASTTNLESFSRSQQTQLARLSDSIQCVNYTNSDIRNDLITLPDRISHAVAGLLSRSQNLEIADNKQLVQGKNKTQMFDVLNWLKAPDPSATHLRMRKLHMAGTGQWLFESAEFKGWLSGQFPWLWICGAPGKGKSVLCSQAIEYLANHTRQRQGEVTTYFYFEFSTEANCDTTPWQRLLISLIVQLVDRRGALLPDLQEAYARNIQHTGTLESIVVQLLRSQVRAYVVVDALDECPEAWSQGQDVVDGLRRLSASADNVRVLTTSRITNQHEEIDLPKATIGVLNLARRPFTINDDIRRYVAELMDRAGVGPTAIRRTLIDQELEGGESMFRWISVQMARLEDEPLLDPAKILQNLKVSPTTLSETYSAMFSKIEDPHRGSALSLLQWIAYASRPLTTHELVTAIDQEAGTRVTSLEDESALIRRLLGPCAALVVISSAAEDRHDFNYHDSATATVRLGHVSVRDFISGHELNDSWLNTPSVDIKEPHAAIASRCIEYLHDIDQGAHRLGNAENSSFALRDYATCNWKYHLDMARRSSNSNVARHLDELERLAESMPKDSETTHAQSSSPTGILTFGKLQSIGSVVSGGQTLQIRRSNTSVDNRSSDAASQLVHYFPTPLQQACFKGRQNLVHRLLKHGADIHVQSGRFCSALHVAPYYGHADIVTTLLKAGANVNAQGGCFGTALQAAIAADQEEVIDVLLDEGADVNIMGDGGKLLEANETGSGYGAPDYYDLPIRGLRRVTTE